MPAQDQVHSADNRKSDTDLSKQSTPEKKNPTHDTPSHGVMVETMDGVRCSQPDSPCANGGPPNDRARRHHNIRSISESACEPSLPEFSLNENEMYPRTDADSFNYDTSDLPFPPFPDEVLLPVPPDGGWGWVIVVASFVCCAVIDGLCSVFGVLLPDLVAYFEESSSKVSLAGSVLAGGFLLSGPVASIIINCFGCRWATIIGAILSATSLITCIYSTSVFMFILLFGALGGLGIGLIYLPASVMVGYYFERRRGLAAGISSAGAGFGMLTLTLLAAFLVQHYSWKGCLIIMAGVSLQCLVCGALMRPLVPSLSVLRPEAFHTEDEKDDEKDQKKTAVAKSKLVQPKFSPNLEVIKENVAMSSSPPKPSEPPADTSNTQNTTEVVNTVGLSPGTERPSQVVNRRLAGVGSCVELDRKRTSSMSSATRPINAAKRRRVSQERLPSGSKDYHSCQELSYGKVPGSLLGLGFKRASSIILEPTVNPLMKKDIFYSGSFTSLQNSMPRSDKDSESAIVSIPDLYHPAAFEQNNIFSQAVHMLKEMMDVSILCNASFLIICASSVLIQLAYFVPIVFLPAYGLSVGLSSGQAAMLLAVAGLSTTFGRATAGALASLRCVNGLHLNCLSLIVAGIATNLVYLCTNFEQLMLYGAVFGISVSGFVPMTTVFLVKYIGLDKLTNSFGLLSMIKGIATMAGPPIAGALLDSTGSYNSPFLFSGCLFIASGILFYFLPLTHRPVSLRYECAPFYCTTKRNDPDIAEIKDFQDDLLEDDATGQTFGSH